MAAKRTIPVTIFGQEYRIRSDADEASIRQAAGIVDETMARVRDRTGTVDTQGVAVLAALNIANQLLASREGRAVHGPTDSGYPVGYWALIADPDDHTLEISDGQEVALTVAGTEPG